MDRIHWSLVNLPQLRAKCANHPAGLTDNPRGLKPCAFQSWHGCDFLLQQLVTSSCCCLGSASLCGPGSDWRHHLVRRPEDWPFRNRDFPLICAVGFWWQGGSNGFHLFKKLLRSLGLNRSGAASEYQVSSFTQGISAFLRTITTISWRSREMWALALPSSWCGCFLQLSVSRRTVKVSRTNIWIHGKSCLMTNPVLGTRSERWARIEKTGPAMEFGRQKGPRVFLLASLDTLRKHECLSNFEVCSKTSTNCSESYSLSEK